MTEAFKQFKQDMQELGYTKNYDWDSYRNSMKWKVWIKGYNACVNEHNKNILSSLNINEGAKRCFNNAITAG